MKPPDDPRRQGLSGARICLVTAFHPSFNPRLVKEADALVAAGARVRIVHGRYLRWAAEADRAYERKPWGIEAVCYGEMASFLRRNSIRVRYHTFRRFRRLAPGVLSPLAIHPIVPELTRAARAEPADLYIGHTLPGLVAAYDGARRCGAKLGFDAEEFHRGQFLADSPNDKESIRSVSVVERGYIPHCDYVSAASDGIAQAYARNLGISTPHTILNVFDSDKGREVDQRLRDEERGSAQVSIYWFSLSIGPRRGLEAAVAALKELPPEVHITLRGRQDISFCNRLVSLARELGVAERLRLLPQCPPGELIVRASCHDIGLALEPPQTENGRVTISNKIFTYLAAGIPIVLTDVPGQRAFYTQAANAAVLCDPDDPMSLAKGIRALMEPPEARIKAAECARELGRRRYNWSTESRKFIEIVARVLSTSSRVEV